MISHHPHSKTPASPIDVLIFERRARENGYMRVAGLDEAGRGPLAGPVVAAAVILQPDICLQGVDDSKRISSARRYNLFDIIKQSAQTVGIGLARCWEIDTVNILEATRLAMVRAITKLSDKPDYLLLDAIRIPSLQIPQEPIVKGDRLSHSIAAASIIAKVTRDRIMEYWDTRYPQYGWRKNKGYGTRDHLEAIRRFGPCPLHRRTFRGVCHPVELFD